MRLHRICGVRFRSHLRSYARAYAYRGLTAFASLSMAVSDRVLAGLVAIMRWGQLSQMRVDIIQCYSTIRSFSASSW
ncbi:MAG: hypothetical protein ABW087_00905 [Candidatus Thiodiazotropha sp.]